MTVSAGAVWDEGMSDVGWVSTDVEIIPPRVSLAILRW